MIPRFGGYLRIEMVPWPCLKTRSRLEELGTFGYVTVGTLPETIIAPCFFLAFPKKKVDNTTTKFHTFGCLLFCNVMIPDAQLCTVYLYLHLPQKIPKNVGHFGPPIESSGNVVIRGTRSGCHGASGRVTFPSWDGFEGPKGRKLKSNVTKKNPPWSWENP